MARVVINPGLQAEVWAFAPGAYKPNGLMQRNKKKTFQEEYVQFKKNTPLNMTSDKCGAGLYHPFSVIFLFLFSQGSALGFLISAHRG